VYHGFSVTLVSDIWNDLRYAARTLRRSPGFTASAILTLALGIGANTAIFSFVDNVLLKPLPYPEPDRIMRVLQKRYNGAPFGITTLDFLDWQKQNTVFESLAAQAGWGATLTGEDEPTLLRGVRVSASFFDMSRVKPILGRTFLPEEDRYGNDHVVILSHALWTSKFGADRGIIGRSIRLDNEPYVIVGVMPAGSVFDRTYYQIMKPIGFSPADTSRGFHWFGAFARLKTGVTVEQARTQMDAIAARLAQTYPDTNSGFGVLIERFSDVLVGRQLRTSLLVLLAGAGMVLLIGCANLANLALARGIAREREVAIRAAMGAGRRSLIVQFLTENVLLSVLGGAVGILVGYVAIHWLKLAIPPTSLPAEADITLDGRVLLFALGISVFTGLLFGLFPALRVTKPDLAGVMKEGGRGSTVGGARRWLGNGLVVAEVTIAFVLLSGSGLLIQSFFGMQNVDLGFNSTDVLTMGLPTPPAQYPDMAQLNGYLRNVRLAIEAVPGVRDVAFTGGLPLRGANYGLPMQVAGTPLVNRPLRGLYFFKAVSPSYFRTFGIRLRRGRVLDEHDTKDAPLVVVINETLARRLFPNNQDPIGQQILIPQTLPGRQDLGDDLVWRIVGVIGNERVNALNDTTTEGLYASIEQNPFYNPSLAVRARVDPQTLLASIRKAVDGVNSRQAFSDVKTMDEIKAETIVGPRFQTILLAAFSGIALALAAVGIYGLISYSVAQRTHEMGIRGALGASVSDLLRLVLRGGLTLTALGLIFGLAGSLALTRLLETLLFGVGVRDPFTMAAAGTILIVVSILACYFPARRAAQVDPAVALRYE
jgi:putative ABC transport system permease protein